MKIYRDEKTQCLQKTILFAEIFANVNVSVFRPLSGRVSYQTKRKR